MATSSDEDDSKRKNYKKLYPFRDENCGQSKRRRSSLASLVAVQDDVSLGGDSRVTRKGKAAPDRFIANATERSIPLCATPRSHRLAKAIEEAGDRRLVFRVQENINPSSRHRDLVPYRKDLKDLTRNLYVIPTAPSQTSASTNLKPQAETTLSAPGIGDDFYTRPAHWSKSNLLAVATHFSVNFRNMNNAKVTSVTKLAAHEEPTCLLWSPGSSHLALGLDWGVSRIFDPVTAETLQSYSFGSRDYVGGLSWKDENVLIVGYDSGRICQFDMRSARNGRRILSHKSRVCGVEWSPDQRFLATGGGDGIVLCWDPRMNREVAIFNHDRAPTSSSSVLGSSSASSSDTERDDLLRRWRGKKHTSTVKALAWCPWAPDLLASGGGTKDGTIRFWCATTGAPRRPVLHTQSQVSSLHFAPGCKELLSTHGYAFAPAAAGVGVRPAPRKHSILVHNYPKGELTGRIFDATHGRVSDGCLSPDGTRLVTCGGGDETIRIYKIFGERLQIDTDGEGMRSQNVVR